MTECLPPISDHPDLTGQARRKRRDSLGVVSWTVRGRTVCPTPGALLRLGSGPSSRTSKTRRTTPRKQVGSAKEQVGRRPEQEEASAPSSDRDFSSRRSRFDGSPIPHRQIGDPADPASTQMEDGGAGEFSGVVRSRCRRWWGWSGQFSPFCVHHHHHKHSSQLISIQDMDIESGHELSNSL